MPWVIVSPSGSATTVPRYPIARRPAPPASYSARTTPKSRPSSRTVTRSPVSVRWPGSSISSSKAASAPNRSPPTAPAALTAPSRSVGLPPLDTGDLDPVGHLEVPRRTPDAPRVQEGRRLHPIGEGPLPRTGAVPVGAVAVDVGAGRRDEHLVAFQEEQAFLREKRLERGQVDDDVVRLHRSEVRVDGAGELHVGRRAPRDVHAAAVVDLVGDAVVGPWRRRGKRRAGGGCRGVRGASCGTRT